MNGVATFRLCTLSNEDLIKKADEMTDKMYQNNEIPVQHIPARPDQDYDLIIGELIFRFQENIKNEVCKCGELVPFDGHGICSECHKPK